MKSVLPPSALGLNLAVRTSNSNIHGWVPDLHGRGTANFTFSRFTTIELCLWSTYSPNTLSQGPRKVRKHFAWAISGCCLHLLYSEWFAFATMRDINQNTKNSGYDAFTWSHQFTVRFRWVKGATHVLEVNLFLPGEGTKMAKAIKSPGRFPALTRTGKSLDQVWTVNRQARSNTWLAQS